MSACDSGRRASFGGRWRVPCQATVVRHVLYFGALPEPLRFCDRHMQQLIAAGLVDNVDVSPGDIARLRERY